MAHELFLPHWSTDHFKSIEFECKCGCGFDTVAVELVSILEEVRQFYNSPVTVNSGCRCESHNKSVGGELGSQHILGTACDFTVKGVNPRKVYIYLDSRYPDKYGIGSYPGWTHFDVRPARARWMK